MIAPAVLPSSREDLSEKLALIEKLPGVSRVQIDVVDDSVATPASWPYNAEEGIEAWVARGEMLPGLHAIQYEIDLMCTDAARAAAVWAAAGASRFIFHAAKGVDLPKLITAVRAHLGCERGSCVVSIGAAFASDTNPAAVEAVVRQVDFIQFMGIARIGRQGEPFDPRVIKTVAAFHALHPDIPVQVDGGVLLENAKTLLNAGATDLVVGSGILKAINPATVFSSLQSLQSSGARTIY